MKPRVPPRQGEPSAVPANPEPGDIVVPRRTLPASAERRRGSRWWTWLLVLLFAVLCAPPAMVLALRWLPPPTTAFMLQSEVKPVAYRWVPAAQIPETVRKAAVAAEDQKFWIHYGFDFEAIGRALEHNERSRRKRGASTITQQVAKNLFLWPGRSWLRKGVEVTFTVLLELMWTKDRILEMYLNIAEFGPGIYGVEAAAQKFFGKPAAGLTPMEAARLAAVLPSPRRWRADRPGPYVQSRAAAILRLMGYGPPPTSADEELLAPAAGDESDPAETGDAPAAEEASDDEPPAIDTAPQETAPEFSPSDADVETEAVPENELAPADAEAQPAPAEEVTPQPEADPPPEQSARQRERRSA